MPEWVTLPSYTTCEGDVICSAGYSLSPDLIDTCIMNDWQNFEEVLCIERTQSTFNEPSRDCPNGWRWIESRNSCIPEEGVYPNSHWFWWVWDPHTVSCPSGFTYVEELNSCLPDDIISQDQTVLCPLGWIWDACEGICSYVGFELEVEYCWRCDFVHRRFPNAIDITTVLPPWMVVGPNPTSRAT